MTQIPSDPQHKNLWEKIKFVYCHYTILTNLFGCFLITFVFMALYSLSRLFQYPEITRGFFSSLFATSIYASLFLTLPLALCIQNIVALIRKEKTKVLKTIHQKVEVLTILAGVPLSYIWIEISDVMGVDWNGQLYNNQLHSPFLTTALPTLITMGMVGLVGYIICRFVPLKKQPPLVSVFAIGGLYCVGFECIMWLIQNTASSELFPVSVFVINLIMIIFITIRQMVYEKSQEPVSETSGKKSLQTLLQKATLWPILGLVAALPILGIVTLILICFGQEPNAMIKAWTETADWTLSQKVGPPNLTFDEHYLCTVAAGGHPKVVKPIRTGMRHGHMVMVNRQLEIANAFEQVLEEKTPRFHKVVRGVYDSTGYPIAKHIHSPYVADAIYFFMKPLEWIFLVVLYLTDPHPEDRIAVQYPHAPLP